MKSVPFKVFKPLAEMMGVHFDCSIKQRLVVNRKNDCYVYIMCACVSLGGSFQRVVARFQ